MYTLDEIKAILDADDYNTIEGYNLIRTNLMTKLSPAITEMEDLNAQLKTVREENERLKQANITLYNKVESQIMGKPDENDRSGDPNADDQGGTDPSPAETLAETVKAYAEDI